LDQPNSLSNQTQPSAFTAAHCNPAQRQDINEPSAAPAELAPPVGVVLGAVLGLIAALFYTASNIALRGSVGVDPFLVTAVKSHPMLVLMGPFVAWMWATGRTVATSWQMLPRLIFAAFVAHCVGNSCFQFSLSIIGLAASVPITLGSLIVGGAVFGRIVLLEPVRPRTLASMMLIIAAVIVLSLPSTTDSEIPLATPKVPLWSGALWAIGAGLSYAYFGVITRQTLTRGISVPATMLTSALVGALTLTPFALLRLGWEPIAAVTAQQWVVMYAAGLFNWAAFIALTISLKALPVVAVNLLNATQVAMAAVAGIILFSESLTLSLFVGIALTFMGLVVLASRRETGSKHSRR